MKKVLLLVGLISILLAAGCGTDASVSPTATLSASVPSDAQQPEPTLASSELVVGPERFVFGLLDPKTHQPINDVPDVSIQFFKVHDDGTATKTGDAQAIFRNKNLPAGVYVVRTDFTEAGKWGALMTISRQGLQPYSTRVSFDVLAKGSVPRKGDPAPPSKNDTEQSMGQSKGNLDQICSAQPHDDMHKLTIAEAVKSGKPSLILFAAPGFCPSFTCGPDLEVVQTIESKYRDKANFLHIESPNDIQNQIRTTHDPNVSKGVDRPQIETAKEWGLHTEPWVFLVDKNGKIFERFEGGLTLDEVQPEFEKLMQQ
ncbi:MAG: hypothetical protein M3014_04910 [Chloroflexota bacterium]|nr:hypothetical protein [Chloroflexota bacterium]